MTSTATGLVLCNPCWRTWHAGNDLTEEITPIEAGLKWTIGKRRRDACDFLGGEVRDYQQVPQSVINHSVDCDKCLNVNAFQLI